MNEPILKFKDIKRSLSYIVNEDSLNSALIFAFIEFLADKLCCLALISFSDES